MTAAYFEDHPTDPDKVILRKPYSTDCPNCEYHRQRAQRWRDEAYKLSGNPLPEREWVGLIDDAEIFAISNTMPYANRFEFARAIEAKLKEKNGL